MEHSNAVHDISVALTALRYACQKHHIPVPDILRWSDPKEAIRAKQILYSVATLSEFMNFRITQPSDAHGDQIVRFNIEYV